MAAAADASKGEVSDTETTDQASTESEPSAPSDSSPTEDQAATGGDIGDGKTSAADSEPDSDEDPDSDGENDSDELDAADEDDEDDEDETKRRISLSPVRLAMVVGMVALLAVGGVSGWLGYRTYQLRQDQEQRELFLRVGRQGAVNLTTIDWHNASSDIQRILDLATGKFYDDFSARSQPFVDVVKKVQSKSVGTVTASGLESMSGNEARVLVAVSVKTSNVGAEDQPPRAWRMSIDVQKVDGGAKVSNVSFVPS
jgi:Mce-associated membrane protein